MSCQVFRNNAGEITSVTAPNGKPSNLFQSINKLVSNKEQALRHWAQVYTPSFKRWFGDWQSGKGSKVVDENGEPLLVFHGTGSDFAEFDKELRGSTTGRSADGSKSFDAENAFFFTNNENVAFNYAIMARQQELMLISSSLQTITSTLSWDQKRRQEVYDNLRKESPKFAAYIDGLKTKGLTKEQIMENLKVLAQKYRSLERDYAGGGSISNPRRYYNDMENEVNKLEKNKQVILSGKYTSVSKFGIDSNTSYSLGYESVYLTLDGVINGKINAVPELAQFTGRNITSLSSQKFDTFVSGLRKVVVLGRDKVEQDIKNGGFTPNLMPVFLNVKSPVEKNFNGEPFVMQADGRGALMEVSKLVKQGAENKNVDGAILKDIADPERADNFVVYEPNQIKSLFNQGTYSEQTGNIYQQQERQSEQAPDENIDNKIKRFLSSIGIRLETVNQLKDREGKPLSGIAVADMLNKIIQVVEGQADITTLPEEAAHFFVEMLGVNSPLYKEMYDKITGYKLYSQVVAAYKDNKLYRNSDGTINFNKLKKEAIGKLIMSYVITQERGIDDSTKVLQAQKWWAKVWKFITELFAKAGKRNGAIENPFATAANKILENDIADLDENNLSSEMFLQDSSTEDYSAKLFNRVKADQSRITLDPKKHLYSVDAQEIRNPDGSARSVSENVVKPWYKSKFPVDKRTDIEKIIDNIKAEYGTELHEYIDKLIERYVNKDTGLLRSKPLVAPPTKFNLEIQAKLDVYIRSLLMSYPSGTRFMSEVKLYNSRKRMPGTTDLIAFLKDGSVDVYDWKSQEVRNNETELKWFKEPAYRIQLDEYTDALEKEYGILKFNKVRAIPIRTIFKNIRLDATTWAPSDLKNIEIGPVDATLIPESKEYLLPVVALRESTGDKMLDDLIEKLNFTYDLISQRSTKNKDKKNLELNKLKKTIRNLQVKKDMKFFVQSGLIQIDKYQDKITNNNLTVGEALEGVEIIGAYAHGSKYLKSILVRLKKQIEEETDEVVKRDLEKQQDNYKTMALNAQDVILSLQNKAKELTDEMAKSQGIFGILDRERVMDYLKRNFRSLSTLDTAATQLLNRLLVKARQIRDITIDEKFDKLSELKEKLEDWASSKGISKDKMFDGILNGTDFLNIYSDEYRQERKKAIQKGDIQWIKDNTIFDKEAYEASFKKYKEIVMSDIYSMDPVEDKEKKEKVLLRWIETHNGGQSKVAMLMSKGNFRKPIEKWYSDKYKEMYKKDTSGKLVNKPLVDVYEYFQSLLRDSEKAGMIDYEFGFIPSLHKTKLEAFAFGEYNNLLKRENFLSGIAVDSANQFGKIDPLSGKPIMEIPVYYTRELGQEKSLDLFKVFGAWAAHTENYKAMSSIEDSVNAILFVEQNKGSLQTNIYGKVKKGGKIDSNTINAEVLENHINYQIYGQKIDLSEDKVINVLGKDVSLTRGLQKIMHYFSLKTLAFNPISGTAALVGGTFNASFTAGKDMYFNDSDWGNGIVDYSTRNTEALGFLDYIAPELDETLYRRTRQLSINEVVKKVNAEDFFIIQRISDKLVIKPVALAMFRSHMVDDNGKIVYIRDYVKKMNDYEKIYNLPSADRKALMDKIDKEVEELKKTRSLKVKSKIVNGKFEIEGLKRDSEEVTLFRNKIKKINKNIIGNATHEDINKIRMSMMGQVFMQFRSWIPQMVAERFGDVSYDSELETYTYGKARTFFKHFFDKKFLPLVGELIVGYGDNAIERAKERYREMVIRRREAGDHNFETRMSETQFIDMYLANLRSMKRELLLLLAFLGMITWMRSDDDEKGKTPAERLMGRAISKYFNELAFFYNPTEARILLKSPAPVTGLLEDMYNFFGHSSKQLMGFALSDEKTMKNAHPIKYFNKMLPGVKVAQDMFAIFDDDFRKEMGLR